MISSFLFALSAACVVAMILPNRPSRAQHQLETYYVCGSESHPSSEPAVTSSTHAVGILG